MGDDPLAAEVAARRAAGQAGKVFISPYNDADVIAGQGTIAVELDRQLPRIDAVYSSPLVTQVINKVMVQGKKSTAEKIVYDALAILAERSGKNPVEQLEGGVKALTPVLTKKIRTKAATRVRLSVAII